jgi:hypothetical protein
MNGRRPGWPWSAYSRACSSSSILSASRAHRASRVARASYSATAPLMTSASAAGRWLTCAAVTVSFRMGVTYFLVRWERSVVRVSWESCQMARNAARCGSAPSMAAMAAAITLAR